MRLVCISVRARVSSLVRVIATLVVQVASAEDELGDGGRDALNTKQALAGERVLPDVNLTVSVAVFL